MKCRSQSFQTIQAATVTLTHLRSLQMCSGLFPSMHMSAPGASNIGSLGRCPPRTGRMCTCFHSLESSRYTTHTHHLYMRTRFASNWSSFVRRDTRNPPRGYRMGRSPHRGRNLNCTRTHISHHTPHHRRRPIRSVRERHLRLRPNGPAQGPARLSRCPIDRTLFPVSWQFPFTL
jgi:hypothetical protein